MVYVPQSSSSDIHPNSTSISYGANIPPLNHPSSQLDTEDGSHSCVSDDRIPLRRMLDSGKVSEQVGFVYINFIIDNPVPKNLIDVNANRTDYEFTHMRYSAATCSPKDFKDSRFTLRQAQYDPPRVTELFILMTIHDEKEEESFTKTMHGIIKNVASLCKRNKSRTWGKDGWKSVVVCIVCDGRAKDNSWTLPILAAMGCYQEGVAKTKIIERDVTAHIYEYTPQIETESGIIPVQIIFCIKEEKNQEKISSRRWFFDAFGPILQPNVCVLVDVGAMLGPMTMYHLWKAFAGDSPCVDDGRGEIVALDGRYNSADVGDGDDDSDFEEERGGEGCVARQSFVRLQAPRPEACRHCQH